MTKKKKNKHCSSFLFFSCQINSVFLLKPALHVPIFGITPQMLSPAFSSPCFLSFFTLTLTQAPAYLSLAGHLLHLPPVSFRYGGQKTPSSAR